MNQENRTTIGIENTKEFNIRIYQLMQALERLGGLKIRDIDASI